MDSDASDNFEDLYEQGDEKKHEKLVEKLLSLNRNQQLKKPSRSEPTLHVSEFDLVKSLTGHKDSVQLNELSKVLKDKKSRIKINEKLKKVKKGRTLPKPLEKPQAARIHRGIAYERARLNLDKWEPIVTSNRASSNLSFPLDNDTKLEKKLNSKFDGQFRLKSDLEKELEKLEPVVEEFHIETPQEKVRLTLKELKAVRNEASKMRAHQSYKEAKARRQGKIKSKKFHRLQKKQRIKQQLKEFEELQKTDPEGALKKLEEIDKARAEERFSLRHKSTGRWARNKQVRAKYDKETRQVLAQQLSISKELTKKRQHDSNSDEGGRSESEDEKEDFEDNTGELNGDNSWEQAIKPGKEVADFLKGYRKFWTEKNEEKKEGEEQEVEGEVQVQNEESGFEEKMEEVEKEEKKNNDEEHSEINGAMEEKDEESGEETRKTRNKTSVNETKESVKATKKKQKIKKKRKTAKTTEDVHSQSTSDWEVSLLDQTGELVIGEMFDKLEKKLQQKKLKNVKNLQRKLKRKLGSKPEKKTEDGEPSSKKPDLTLKSQRVQRPILDEGLLETAGGEPAEPQSSTNSDILKDIFSNDTTSGDSNSSSKGPQIDPNKFEGKPKPATNLNTAVPDIQTVGEGQEDGSDVEDEAQANLIAETFADDDVVQEFNKEKKDEVEGDRPKDINLALPGWGCWGGANIKMSKRKKRRFIIKAPPKVPRRDDNKGHLIINEKAQKKIKEHMVSEVPFPFKTVKDFEASIRAPISNTFVPETAFRRLIQPVVTTKMGTVIEPMSRDFLLNRS